MARADLAIRGARVFDGGGGAAVEADVEVREGRVTRVGRAGDAAREIAAEGLALAPGFVDVHTHDDGALLRHPGMEFKLAQGCTSVVIGNCGFSAAPNEPGAQSAPGTVGLFAGLEADWTDLAGFAATVEKTRPAVNAVALVGHNTMRAAAGAGEKRPAEANEIARMRGWLARALEQGACGFSTGLIYRPGRWSSTEEVIEIARPLGEFGAVYATHMRNEADRLLEAVDEALRIGREVGCAVQISHHKSAGHANWGRVPDSLARVDAANAAGGDVTLDVYPYTAGSGPMVEYFDPATVSPEAAALVGIATCPPFPEWQGRLVPDIAKEIGVDPDEVVRRILTTPGGERTLCLHFTMDEGDIVSNLRHPRMMVGSDGIPDLSGVPHPRLFGTFPRVLARYVREQGVLPLEEAIRRMTSLSCERFGLASRGRIAEGYWADLVLFDPASVRDVATYEDPKREPEGIRAVLVNGEIAYDGGRHTGAGAGRFLRYRKD